MNRQVQSDYVLLISHSSEFTDKNEYMLKMNNKLNHSSLHQNRIDLFLISFSTTKRYLISPNVF